MPNPDTELVANYYSISYKYDDFIMTLVSCTKPSKTISRGPSFFGTKGYAIVNRSGYLVMPNAPGRNDTTPTFEPKELLLTQAENVAGERASEIAHVRNWLDCIKSRKKPIADIEIGFHSSLPCLLGRQAVKGDRAITWDPITKTATMA